MADEEGALAATLTRFCQACNDNQRLRQMNRDWNRLVEIRAEDQATGGRVQLRYADGQVELAASESEPDLIVEAPASTLIAIFSGAMTPTEPYMDGSLRVRGSQDDMMRLDIISLLIWGE